MLFAGKLSEKVLHFSLAKEHNESFLKKNNRKSVKQSKIITYKPKTFDTVDIKSDITEHTKTSQKLSKTTRQAERLSFNSSLYSNTEKEKKFWTKKNTKITKQEQAFKGYTSTYNVEILNSFNPELQGKDTKSVIKSKLTELLTLLGGFKFVTILVLVFTK